MTWEAYQELPWTTRQRMHLELDDWIAEANDTDEGGGISPPRTARRQGL